MCPAGNTAVSVTSRTFAASTHQVNAVVGQAGAQRLCHSLSRKIGSSPRHSCQIPLRITSRDWWRLVLLLQRLLVQLLPI